MTEEKLYIIGGSGFVGKNMVRCLHDKYAISVFDKYIDETYFAAYPDIKCYQIELDKEHISHDIASPDYIINLASIVTAERDMSLFDAMIQSNLKVLLNLYECFKEDKSLKLFIQFGSSEEYGEIESPFHETAREEPNSPYALVKQLTTNTAMMLYRNYGFSIMVVRPGNLFGPLQSKSKFIPYVIEQLRTNQPLNVTPCEQKRDFIYVDDFVEGIRQILLHSQQVKGEIINIGSGESIALRDVIEICKAELNSKSIINYGALPYRENEVMDLCCSMDKYIEKIGNSLTCNMRLGLQKCVKS